MLIFSMTLHFAMTQFSVRLGYSRGLSRVEGDESGGYYSRTVPIWSYKVSRYQFPLDNPSIWSRLTPPGDSYQGGGCLQYPVHVGQAGVVARLTASPLTAEVTIQTYNQHSSSLRHFLFNSDCYDTTRTFTRRLGHFLIQNFLAPDCWSDLDEQCDVPIGQLLSIFDQCTTTTNLSSSHWGMFLLLYN